MSKILSERDFITFVEKYDPVYSEIGSMEIEDHEAQAIISSLNIAPEDLHRHILCIRDCEGSDDASFIHLVDDPIAISTGSAFWGDDDRAYIITREPMKPFWDPLDPDAYHSPIAVWWYPETLLLAENGHQLHLNIHIGEFTFTLEKDVMEEDTLRELVITIDENTIRYDYREDGSTIGSLDVSKRTEDAVTKEDEHRCFIK